MPTSEQDLRAIAELLTPADAVDHSQLPASLYQDLVALVKSSAVGPEPIASRQAHQDGRLAAIDYISLPEEHKMHAVIDITVYPDFRDGASALGFFGS